MIEKSREYILEFYQTEQQSTVSGIFHGTKSGEVIRLDMALISQKGEIIPAITRIVRGQHTGNEVLFIVSRESSD